VEIEVQKTFEILLDMEKDLYTPSNLLFNVSTNDFESVELLFTITQDAAPLDLTGKTVDLAIKKPSGLTVYQSIEITDALDGNAAAMLSLQAYVEFGVHAAEVIVRNESQIMVTCPFYYFSREAIMDGETIESSGDWSALQEALFSYDKKPILVDGIPAIAPEYIGQMAFDTGENKRAFIANGLTETDWQVLGAGEGGGGIVDWNSILGKPAAFTPEIHTHDFVDIQAKPAAYPPEAHNHAILDVTGLQAALDAKANTGELGAPVEHSHEILDVTGLQAVLDGKADDADLAAKADVAALALKADAVDLAAVQTALNEKADDADLIPFITESEADVKYALKGETGGAPEAHTHEIADVTGLQGALDGKADDADLTAKADVVHTHAFAAITEKPAAYPPEAHAHDFDSITGKPAAYPPAIHNHAIADVTGLQAAIDGKAPEVHNHAILDVTGLQAALDGKADDADLATKANSADVYQKIETYTKTEVDAIASGITEGGGTIVQDNLSSTSISAALSANQGRILNETKANIADLTTKANSADVYAKTETYNKTEIDADLAGKANTADLAAKADAADLAAKADAVHSHTIANVTGLQGALDGKADDADLTGKADAVHTHAFAQITDKPASYPAEAHNHAILDVAGLQGALDGKADDAHNHTIANVTGLQAALDGKADDADLTGKADVVHSHAIVDVTGLQAALDGKADDADLAAKADVVHSHTFAQITEKPASYPPEAHNHTIANVTGLQAGLDAKADDAHNHAIADVTGLQGALDGKADDIHSHTVAQVTGLQAALDGKADDADLTAKADAVHSHTIANVTGLQAALDGKADDADLIPFITESEADLKYEPIGAGGGGGAWGEITGTISAQTDLQTALDGKSNNGHTHNFLDLANQPDAYTPTAHQHPISDVTGLQTALDGKITSTYADAGDNFIMNTKMAGLTLWKGTQAAYDGLTPDANTLYFITG
jgi:hypothetical protein